MIARGFRPVGWVAAVGGAALGCYMLSLQVASERADLTKLDRRIISAQQNIRALQTELGTRGRIQQLEQWNDEVLALSTPVSGQYVEGSVSLARFDVRQPQLADQAEVRLASAQPPAAAAPAGPQSATPAPQHAVATAPVAAPPLVRRASLTVPPSPAPAPPRASSASASADAQAREPARTRPAATQDRKIPATAAAGPRAETPARTRIASADEPPRRADAVPPRARAATSAPRAATATPPRASLLGDRTLRALGTASRGERDRGTGN